jgi:two-component system nitrogen regulation sensor histidine kinase GlnL
VRARPAEGLTVEAEGPKVIDAHIDPGGILAALPDAILVLDVEEQIVYANQAAEQLFDTSAAHLVGQNAGTLLAEDSPLLALVRQVRRAGASVSEDGVTIDSPRFGSHFVALRAAPLGNGRDPVVVSIHERSIARKIDRQLVHRGAARSVTAMAVMLAHEVKNPLSGIRGAAQLLEQSVAGDDRELTRLICDEADRIVALVDRMEVFSDGHPLERGPVNIHQVLDHVRKVAYSGFARHVRFSDRYDPSLPAVYGNRDLLIQVFLNLLKNAAEAVPQVGGEIAITTAYQQGVRLAVPGADSRMMLPLVVTIEDNGHGIPEDLRPHLFDPFVTSKVNGTGLGLALVAKVIGDHGGVIEFESEPRRTVFRVMLPIIGQEAGKRG